MIILTKLYRLIWDTLTLEILNDWRKNYGYSQTLTNNYAGYMESDNFSDIETYVYTNPLWEKDSTPPAPPAPPEPPLD